MPIVEISLVPPGLAQEVLRRLVRDLNEAISGIPELELPVEEVTVLLPADLLASRVGSELIVRVFGLFKKPGCTKEVCDRLWSAIGEVVKDFAEQYVPQCTKVEVVPIYFNQETDGFWSVSLPGRTSADTTQISEIGLSVRAQNILLKSRIRTLQQLLDIDAARILRIRNAGPKVLEDINERLSALGYPEKTLYTDRSDTGVEQQ